MLNTLIPLADYNLLFAVGAAGICTINMLIAVRIICRAAMVSGRSRTKRLLFAAAVAGNGVWATHFIAMLGCPHSFSTLYRLLPTLLSFIVATGLFLPAWRNEIQTSNRSLSPATALYMTLAVGGMHYIGIFAINIRDVLVNMPAYHILISIISGFILFYIGTIFLRREKGAKRSLAALWWLLAVCCLHFLGMPQKMQMEMSADHLTQQLSFFSLIGMVGAGTSTRISHT